jgi:hypothetical protein
LESTDWWQEKTNAEREWLWLSVRNPTEAARFKEDNYLTTYAAFVDLGMEEISDELVTYMSNQFTQGLWSTTFLKKQIELLFTPGQEGLDEGLATFLSTEQIDLGDPALSVSDVRAQWSKWLGPAYPPSDTQIQDWAAKLRTGGEGARDQLTEHLRAQRLAMFPGYENPDLTYDDIASPWRGFMTAAWGQTPDETDETFQQVIRLNDTNEAGKLLRREGINQNIGKVKQDTLRGLFDQTSSVRRAI